jgi:hypothetical protein
MREFIIIATKWGLRACYFVQVSVPQGPSPKQPVFASEVVGFAALEFRP